MMDADSSQDDCFQLWADALGPVVFFQFLHQQFLLTIAE